MYYGSGTEDRIASGQSADAAGAGLLSAHQVAALLHEMSDVRLKIRPRHSMSI